MAEKTQLPPVPASILPVAPPVHPAAPRTAPPQPTSPPAFRSVYDAAPADTLKIRDTAAKTRNALSATLKSLVATSAQVADAVALSGDTRAAAILDLEGLSPADLQAFLKLAKPLIDNFTAPPPTAA